MRGALDLAGLPIDYFRIIPADAGSTLAWINCLSKTWDHPRGCGEHIGDLMIDLGIAGSSPRMRGAPYIEFTDVELRRIIPADAGSTNLYHVTTGDIGDHPRGCGEHANRSYTPQFEQGSSPRMRGALAVVQVVLRGLRIIPADAGSTSDPRAECGRPGNHPRGCGEHQVLRSRKAGRQGSSPRMRGAPRLWCGHGL